MKTKLIKLLVTVCSLGILGGCAAVAPTALVDARDQWAKSNGGLAGKLTPTEMYDAKNVLDKANTEFSQNGDNQVVRDYAYIATRKIELADAKARTELDRQKIGDAVKAGVVVRDEQVKSTLAALDHARAQLKDERNTNSARTSELQATNAAQSKEIESSNARADAERAERETAEAKLAGAMKDLATIAAVREDPRGVVITLSGAVLFASGKFALLETAKTKLNQVSDALKAQGDDKTIVVEGHTDSQGSDASNLPLSVNRANAVRDYLVSTGIVSSRISATGKGSTQPLLSNSNAENRANNRRVEIVVQPSPLTAR